MGQPMSEPHPTDRRPTEVAGSRTFQVWRYLASHRQLLLRSVKTADAQSQVDVLFKNVIALKAPTHLESLRIVELAGAAAAQAREETSELEGPNHKVYALEGAGYAGYVIAGAL